MTIPSLQEFQASARKALNNVGTSEDILALFDKLGPSFDFLDDGGIDSIEMADVVHYINKDLDIKLQLEKLELDDTPITLDNLFKSIKENPHTSA